MKNYINPITNSRIILDNSDRFKPSEDSIETLLAMYDFAVSVEVTNHINGTNGKTNGHSNGKHNGHSNGNYSKKAAQAIKAKGFLEEKKNGHDLEIMTALAYRGCCIGDEEHKGIDYHFHFDQDEIESSLSQLVKIVKNHSGLSNASSNLLSDIIYVNKQFPEECPLRDFFFGDKKEKKKCEKKIITLNGKDKISGEDILSFNQYYGRLAMVKAAILEFFVPYSIFLEMDESSEAKFLNSTSFIYYEEVKHGDEIKLEKRMGESDILLFCRKRDFYKSIEDNPYFTLESFEN